MTTDERGIRDDFWRTPIACAAIVILIHLLPKQPAHQPIRLAMTIGYFSALIVGVWSALSAHESYMKRSFAARYEDCGPVIEKSWQMYLIAEKEVLVPVGWLAIGFLASTALGVLSHWPLFGPLVAFAPLSTLVWWITLAGLVGYPFVRGAQLSTLQQRRQMFREQIELADFKPRALSTPPAEPRATVEALGDREFRAGNFDWSWDDFYRSAIIFGQTGTGKTVCVLNAILDGFLASTTRSERAGGLILDPKGDFNQKIRTVLRKYGREDDLLVLDPSDLVHTLRYNPLDTADDELEVASRFAAAMECLGMKSEKDSFWIDSAKKALRHAIALVRLTNQDGEPPTFAQLNEVTGGLRALSRRADMLADDDPRGDQALAFFANEWVEYSSEMRSSIQSHITNMLDPFLMEPYRTVFTGRSTMRIADMIDRGKILYVYMPVADKEAMARVVCTLVKLEYFREVLKRIGKPRPTFFVCDEFQQFFTTAQGKGNPDFFERSRQSNHANVIATQNLPALTKQAEKDDPVKNLLGNCAVKIFLRNTDETTNEYASKLFGENLVQFWGGSVGASGGGVRGRLMAQSSQSSNLQYDAVVRKEVFSALAVPSRPDKIDYAETILHLSSRGHVTREKLRWKIHPLTA